MTPGSQKYHEIGQKILFETSGFCIERTDSLVQAAGRGVKVTQGTIPQGAVTSLYCGSIDFILLIDFDNKHLIEVECFFKY